MVNFFSRESPVTHTTSISRAERSFSAVKGSFTTEKLDSDLSGG